MYFCVKSHNMNTNLSLSEQALWSDVLRLLLVIWWRILLDILEKKPRGNYVTCYFLCVCNYHELLKTCLSKCGNVSDTQIHLEIIRY